MRNFARIVLASSLSFLLAACYSSHTPLIEESEAHFPLGDSISYLKASPDSEWSVEGTLTREGDHYLDSDTISEEPSIVLFQHLQDDLFLVQERSLDSSQSYYDLARMTPGKVEMFGLRCEPAGNDRENVANGLLAYTESGGAMGGNTCFVGSLDAIKQILLSHYSTASVPKDVYTYTP